MTPRCRAIQITGGEIDEIDYKMAAVVGSDSGRGGGGGCFSQAGMQSNWQRGEDVLLRNTEERKISVQTDGQNARQVLLHRNVADKAD